MASPESMEGQTDTCPECGNVAVVPPSASAPRKKTKKKTEPKPKLATERQIEYADSLGFIIPPDMDRNHAGELLTCHDNLKHYIFGMIIDLTGKKASQLKISKEQVNYLASRIMQNNPNLAEQISILVEELGESEFFLKNKNNSLYRSMAKLVKKELVPATGSNIVSTLIVLIVIVIAAWLIFR